MEFRVCCCLLAFFFLDTTFVSALKGNKYQGTPALLTIKSPDGDLIDCIDKRKQPTFNNLLLRNHKIQRVPRQWRGTKLENKSNKVTQLWLKNGTRCSKGTIPIRRTMTDNSVLEHGKKQDSFHHQLRGMDIHREQAMATYNVQGEIYQVKAKINVWNPRVEILEEYSDAKIRITAGEGENLNIIEAGWQVYPSIYDNSRRTRLFIFTRDASHPSGCYNLECEAFFQSNPGTVIGGSIDRISTYEGLQSYITIDISQEPPAKHWWLRVDGVVLGYWPNDIFTSLANPATHVSWGGGVLNARSNNRHTSTEMGSGRFANMGFEKAASFEELGVKNQEHGTLNPVSIQHLSRDITDTSCYNMAIHNTSQMGCYFYFGGSGRNSNCP